MDFISQGLKAMDTSAVTMCMENNVPILAFALLEKDSIVNALTGNLKSGTWIK
jgi:uridylate kinase